MKDPYLKGLLCFLTTMLIYSAMDAWAKALLTDIPMAQIGWVRFAVHTAVLGGILVYQGQLTAVAHIRLPGLQLLRALSLLGVMVSMYLALQSVSLANASALVALSPFIVALGARWLLQERVSLRGWIAITAGFIGAMLIIRPGTGVFQWTALFALLTGFCFAVQQLVSRYLTAQQESPWVTLFITAAVATVLLSFWVPFYWQPMEATSLFSIVCLGLMAAAGDLMLLRAFTYAPAARLAPYSFSMVVFGSTIGYLAFDDIPDMFTIIGALIITTSGVALLWRPHRIASPEV